MPGLSDKLLIERLRDLERLGLVEKRQGKVYGLTARGESLRPVLDALFSWDEAIAEELPVTVATGPSLGG